jgi:hypothetical protein
MPRFVTTDHALPAGPPPEVLEEIDAAWERSGELFASGLELHFELDGSAGPVRALLLGSDGSVVERLSASEALALACGEIVAGLVPAA